MGTLSANRSWGDIEYPARFHNYRGDQRMRRFLRLRSQYRRHPSGEAFRRSNACRWSRAKRSIRSAGEARHALFAGMVRVSSTGQKDMRSAPPSQPCFCLPILLVGWLRLSQYLRHDTRH